DNLVTSGNYHILYCGRGPGSKAVRLQTLIPQFQEDLKLVLADVNRSTTSKAYRAYFKSPANAAYVESIFQAISDGTLLQIKVPGAPSNPNPVHPTIVCLDRSLPPENRRTLQALCGTTRDGAKPAASIIPQSHWMILCQEFWKNLETRPERSKCPAVRRNKFIPDDHRVMINKFGAFVHEFAHAYIHNWDPNEIYAPMDAVELSASLSLKNANNFALYAASEYSPPSFDSFGFGSSIDR
ncbi:MAG: hypothetical protein Q9169_008432, partial [Polycauliona sp. 2 TL-2023]